MPASSRWGKRSLTQRGPAGDFIDHWHKQMVPTHTREEGRQRKHPECSKARITIRKVMQQHTHRENYPPNLAEKYPHTNTSGQLQQQITTQSLWSSWKALKGKLGICLKVIH